MSGVPSPPMGGADARLSPETTSRRGGGPGRRWEENVAHQRGSAQWGMALRSEGGEGGCQDRPGACGQSGASVSVCTPVSPATSHRCTLSLSALKHLHQRVGDTLSLGLNTSVTESVTPSLRLNTSLTESLTWLTSSSCFGSVFTDSKYDSA